MKKITIIISLLISVTWLFGQNAWINELHYDNDGGDVGEFVEIVIENSGTYALSDFQVDLYNGNNGEVYASKLVSIFTVGNTEGNFTIYYVNWAGLQNGSPDGLSLSYQGTLITGQFLSYEGSFAATDGPASGITSTDIGVSETGATPIGQSLQLLGNGAQYSDFTWQAPATETKGALNNSQTFTGGGGVDNPSSFAAATAGTDQINLSWAQNGNSNNVMLAWSSDGTFGIPSGSYVVGNPITGGGTVIYNGSNTSFNHTSLTAGTQYYYKAWSVDGTVTYSSGVSTDNTTLAVEPTTDATSPTAVANSTSEITVSWTDATGIPESYLIKGSDVSYADITNPVDGSPESDGSLVQNIAAGVGTYQFTGLTPSTTYYFEIFPYNGDNGSVNYKTSTPAQANTPTQDPTGAAAGDIVITEVIQNPSDVSDDHGEWFEIYNTTGSDIDVDGWTISDAGSDSHIIDNGGSLLVPAGGFLIMGIDANISTNGGAPVDYEYSGIALSNSDDELILTSDESVEIDKIEWDGGTNWPDPTGASMTYIGLASDNNNDGSKWITAVARENNYTNPGVETDKGSPNSNGLFQNLITTTTWTGTGNWSEGNGVGATNWSNGSPGSAVNVTVDGTVTVDLIISNKVAECNDLTLSSDAAVTIPVNNGITVYGDLDIASSKSRAAANLTVQSDVNGNGSLIVEGTATGSATVKRFMEGYDVADNGWHIIGSPVDNMLISGSEFDPTGTSDDLYQWDEPTGMWENYKGANTFPNFINGKGYLCAIQATDTRNFVGTLNTSDFTRSGLTKDVLGFNLLGNPYASALIWKNGDWTLTNVGAVAQIWEEANNDYTEIGANDIIPSTNGFFVEVASNAGGSVAIPASARTHDATNNYKNAVSFNYQETLNLKVTNDANMYYDICRIGFKDDATEAWDMQYDSHKLFGGTSSSQLWSVLNDENFGFNYLPYVYESYQLPLHFRAGATTMHHLVFEGIESFYMNSEIFLEDLFLNEIIDLREQQSYNFTATVDDDENRFILHFYGVTSTYDKPELAEISVFSHKNTIYIKSNQIPKDNYRVEVFNVMGQNVISSNIEPSTLSSIKLNEKLGIYIVRVHTENGIVVQKVLIN